MNEGYLIEYRFFLPSFSVLLYSTKLQSIATFTGSAAYFMREFYWIRNRRVRFRANI